MSTFDASKSTHESILLLLPACDVDSPRPLNILILMSTYLWLICPVIIEKLVLYRQISSITFFPDLKAKIKSPAISRLQCRSVALECQFCEKEIQTKTEKIHWKHLHSKKEYWREIMIIILISLIPFTWPFTVRIITKRPWLGIKHLCPECELCIGIHFNPNYTGFALTRNQALASIPFNPLEGRIVCEAF